MALTRMGVKGFKSFGSEVTLDMKPLTILAGANSSGKSAFMQPLLLLKQTLDEVLDPGPLLLDGPHVGFTSAEQVLSRAEASGEFSIMLDIASTSALIVFRDAGNNAGFELDRIACRGSDGSGFEMREGPFGRGFKFARTRFLLEVTFKGEPQDEPVGWVATFLANVVHVSGLRSGVGSRTFRKLGAGGQFPGPFDEYAPSVLHHWGESAPRSVKKIDAYLRTLNLSSGLSTQSVGSTVIEVLVGMPLQSRGRSSMVSLADVGLGVSSVLPVLSALQTDAELIYIEEPELHLHPRAQLALAGILAREARKGRVVVVETHSALLLRGLQTAIASGELDPSLAAMHWFSLDRGRTTVRTAEIAEDGSFGDWPADFDDVYLESERDFLKASLAGAKAS